MQSKISTYRISIAVLALLLLSACSVKKYIPEGELLFLGGEVKVIDTVGIENKSGLETELQNMLYPEPNTKFLGLYPGLHYYYRAQKENPNFIVRFLNKKIGEEPAYFSSVKINKTKDLLENRLQNNGFFYGKLNSSIVKDSARKTAETNYTVAIGKPYQLNNYTIEVDSLEAIDSFPIYKELQKSLSETILEKGNRYNLRAFKTERSRIDQYLKERGYYNFNSEFILFQADTNLNKYKTFNLFLKLKKGVPQKSKVPYVIDEVNVFANVSKNKASTYQDSTLIDSIAFIQEDIFFKPKRLRPFIRLKPGQLYDPIKSKYTSQRISSIGTYKFVNIDYEELDSPQEDSLQLRHLKATISLSPLTKRSLLAELQGVTKSNSFTGPNLSLTYLNRNTFKGGENFSASGNFGYEKQLGRKTNGSSSLRLGLKTSIEFPRLIFPGNLERYFKYAIPKTKVTTAFDYFRRSQLYTLNSYSASFGYRWNASRYVNHHLDPININYVKLGKRSVAFDSILDSNPFLKRSFEQQFIAGLNYTFNYNELNNSQKKGRFTIRFNYDMAGSTVSLLGRKKVGDSTESFLGLAYAQYVKGDVDISYHYKLGESGHEMVGRVFGGIGIPYGNSASLPYVKQYFSGGSYSVRAFQIRGIGPGVYNPSNNESMYFDRSGDIRLEGNLEYRFPLISILKGAVFIDAGNIWNLDNKLAGGKFTSDFIHQFGVGSGFGLRVDVQGFVIRFDLAAPLKRPEKLTWKLDYKNPVFNFAIGYPF